MNPQTSQLSPDAFKQRIVSKYPTGISSDGVPYAQMDATELTKRIVAKYPTGVTSDGHKYSDFLAPAPKQETSWGLLQPAREAVQGLGTLYGGGEQGIAKKLASDVQAGAQDISQGNWFKGIAKAGLRTAGDVAGAIFAPVGAALQATGINKAFDYVGEKIANSSVGNAITDMPSVQNFAISHPNAGEDFGRALNLAMSAGEKTPITPKGMVDSAKAPFIAAKNAPAQMSAFAQNLRPTAESIAAERQAKITKGFEEQNTRLKTADKAFTENTKVYNEPDPTTGKTTKTTVTPIDTFAKHNIAPVIDKGSIQMGDYKLHTGELGKIRSAVDTIDSAVDTKLVNTGKTVPTRILYEKSAAEIRANPELQAAGKVGSTIAKLEGVFADYTATYGENLPIEVVNKIRKAMNKDWHPDTVDASRSIGDAARDLVYNATDDLIVKKLLREQGELLAAKKYAERVNGTKVTGGRLGNMALRTTGAILGATVEKAPLVGSVLGMIGGEYAARGLQQSQFRSGWTELKALIQRSNKSEPIQSDSTTVSKIPISPNDTGIAGKVVTSNPQTAPEKSSAFTPKINDLVSSVGKQDLRTVMINLEKGGFSKAQIAEIMKRVIEKNTTGRFTPKEISDVARQFIPKNPPKPVEVKTTNNKGIPTHKIKAKKTNLGKGK